MNNKYLLFSLDLIKKNKSVIIGVIILLVLFCWFFWRPAHIRKICAKQATGTITDSHYLGSSLWSNRYSGCLKTNGIKE
jgi:hypothetical protein